MAKEAAIETTGIVIENLSNAQFKVKLDNNDHTIIAYLSGNMSKNQIRIVVGDRVRVQISPYDLTKGRISFREK